MASGIVGMFFRIWALLAMLVAGAGMARAELVIVTDIAPVSALLRDVTGAPPRQILPDAVSPHDFALRPSDMRLLQEADLIVWLGPQASPGLAKAMQRIDFADKALDLSAVPGTFHLPVRRAGRFGRAGDAGGTDPHLWLDPDNARLWAAAIAARLALLDPARAGSYDVGLARLAAALDAVEDAAKARLGRDGAAPYLQFHDAFQYFERHFGLQPLGAATAGDEESLSLGIVADLRSLLAEQPGACLFLSDANEQRRAAALLDNMRIGWLDALGRTLPASGYSYPDLIAANAEGFTACLYPAD